MALTFRMTFQELSQEIDRRFNSWRRSNEMKEALRCYQEFEAAKNGLNAAEIMQAQGELFRTWAVWCTKKEFRNLDTRMDGNCKRIAVEMGVMPGIDRESNTTAFVLSGEHRPYPTTRKPPQVTVTLNTVSGYIAKLTLREGKSGGIVLIDAFGGGNSPTENGFNRKYGNQESTVMDNIEAVLETAKELKLKMLDVTMGSSATWKNLKDRFPAKTMNIVKPRQGLFDATGGSTTYLATTLAAFADLDYVVVMGWDANQCVASAIFGVEPHNLPYVPGLVDLGIDVVTSRNLLGANEVDVLDSRFGWPYLGPPPRI